MNPLRITWRRPRGVTLIELLAVCVIALLISGATLRTVMPALSGRQVREGARMVNVFINSARNRAIQNNRPTGLWLDRLPSMNEACVSLSFAEVPDPYSGDYVDSGIEAFYWPYDPYQTSPPGAQYYLNVVVASSLTAPRQGISPSRPETWSYTNGTQKFVRPGDLLQVNLQSQPYRLFTDQTLPNVWLIGVGVNQSYLISGKTRVSQSGPFNSVRWSGGRWSIAWFNDLGVQVQPFCTSGSTMTHVGTPVPYQILRQPMRSTAGSMQLPEGVCIDLNFSGTIDTTLGGISGSYSYAGMRPFHPRFDPQDTTLPPSPYRGKAYDPDDTTPVIVMFNPTGSVEQVYCRYWMYGQSGSTSAWLWRGDHCISPLHFLVGQMAKLPFGGSYDGAENQNSNAGDLQNVWVTIHPYSGVVTSDEVRTIPVGYTPHPDMRMTASGTTAGVLYYSNSGAWSGDTMGGR